MAMWGYFWGYLKKWHPHNVCNFMVLQSQYD